MNPLLYVGVDELLQGIVCPIIISLAVGFVRAALWGWHGFRHFIANTTVGIFGGVIAHWILLHFSFDPTINAVIIACCALISKDAMQKIFSRQTAHCIGDAIRRRLEREILHRGAPDRERD